MSGAAGGAPQPTPQMHREKAKPKMNQPYEVKDNGEIRELGTKGRNNDIRRCTIKVRWCVMMYNGA